GFWARLKSFHALTNEPQGRPRSTRISRKLVKPGVDVMRWRRRTSDRTPATELICASRSFDRFVAVDLTSGGGFSAISLSTDSSDRPNPDRGAESESRYTSP